ncbi:MAG: hypothetical protein ACH350_10010 [Parachlamydiaceae bacterium]
MSTNAKHSKVEKVSQESTKLPKEKVNMPKEVQLEFSFMDSLKPSQLKKAGRQRKR